MKYLAGFLLAVTAYSQVTNVKNGTGLITAEIIKNQTAGANGSCYEMRSSDGVAIVPSGRLCGKFFSGTTFSQAGIVFQTVTGVNVFQDAIYLLGKNILFPTANVNNIGSAAVPAATIYTTVLDVDAADAGSSTTIQGPATGTNVTWKLPNSVPVTGDVIIATTSGSTVTLSWTSAICGGTCMTTDTAQIVTGSKSLSGANLLTNTDNTNTIGSAGAEFSSIFGSQFISGIPSTRAGQVTMYSATSAVPAILLGSHASGNPDILVGNVLGNGTLSPVSTGSHDLGYSGDNWRMIYVNDATVAGTHAITATKTVRDAAGTGTCTLVFTGGWLVGGSC